MSDHYYPPPPESPRPTRVNTWASMVSADSRLSCIADAPNLPEAVDAAIFEICRLCILEFFAPDRGWALTAEVRAVLEMLAKRAKRDEAAELVRAQEQINDLTKRLGLFAPRVVDHESPEK